MKYFRDPTGEIFAYPETYPLEKRKPGLTPLTDAEVEALLNPPPVPLTLKQVQELRRRAYVAESDPIKNEADYDALVNGTEPDYTTWMAAVDAIKARYPLPAAPEPEAA